MDHRRAIFPPRKWISSQKTKVWYENIFIKTKSYFFFSLCPRETQFSCSVHCRVDPEPWTQSHDRGSAKEQPPSAVAFYANLIAWESDLLLWKSVVTGCNRSCGWVQLTWLICSWTCRTWTWCHLNPEQLLTNQFCSLNDDWSEHVDLCHHFNWLIS